MPKKNDTFSEVDLASVINAVLTVLSDGMLKKGAAQKFSVSRSYKIS